MKSVNEDALFTSREHHTFVSQVGDLCRLHPLGKNSNANKQVPRIVWLNAAGISDTCALRSYPPPNQISPILSGNVSSPCVLTKDPVSVLGVCSRYAENEKRITVKAAINCFNIGLTRSLRCLLTRFSRPNSCWVSHGPTIAEEGQNVTILFNA